MTASLALSNSWARAAVYCRKAVQLLYGSRGVQLMANINRGSQTRVSCFYESWGYDMKEDCDGWGLGKKEEEKTSKKPDQREDWTDFSDVLNYVNQQAEVRLRALLLLWGWVKKSLYVCYLIWDAGLLFCHFYSVTLLLIKKEIRRYCTEARSLLLACVLASHAIVMSYNRLDLESDNIIMISTAVILSVEHFRGCQPTIRWSEVSSCPINL